MSVSRVQRHQFQDQRDVKGCQGQDIRSVKDWNRLEDYQQETWWEGDSSWREHSGMEVGKKTIALALELHETSYLREWELMEKGRDQLLTSHEKLVNDLNVVIM